MLVGRPLLFRCSRTHWIRSSSKRQRFVRRVPHLLNQSLPCLLHVTQLLLNMARKKAQRKQETTLVPHKTTNLSALLERAKTGESAQAVKAFLDASASTMALVQCHGADGMLQLPLLHSMALYNEHPLQRAESVRLLVEADADINIRAGPDGDDRTAFMLASVRGCCTEVLQVFLQNGADVSTPSAASGSTALHHAAMGGLTDNCRLLLASADSSVHARDVKGHTPLMDAGVCGSVDTVELLRHPGADVNTVDNSNKTPLIVACAHKRTDVAAFLIEAGAEINAVGYRGQNALMVAARSNSTALVQLLLDNGADIGARDSLGCDALFKAATEGQVATMELLECIAVLV
jgi:ankyrin repeat protein